MRQIILDTETTGLHPAEGHRIVEIGCIELLNRKATGARFHSYFNPERESDPDALKVHGLDADFLNEQPLFSQVVAELLDFVIDAEVLIHNAPFDVAFLDAELALVNRGRFATHVTTVVDTLAMAKSQFPGKRNSLDALCQRFGIDNSQRTLHGALLDAELLADVYLAMTRGQNSLMIETEPPKQAVIAASSNSMADLVRGLLVIPANAEEAQAHETILVELAKANGKSAVWSA